jgi:hypothetical protein
VGRLGGTEGETLIGAARSESVPVSEILRDWTRFDADTGKDLAVENPVPPAAGPGDLAKTSYLTVS